MTGAIGCRAGGGDQRPPFVRSRECYLTL